MAKIIGLTGGIASGKSTVTETLERLGAHIIDTDQVAHHCIEPGNPGWTRVVEAFGREILQEDQQIDRKYLGSIVFSDPEKLARLNQLLHPATLEETARLAAAYACKDPDGVIVEEIPLLYEIGLQKTMAFDEIWVVCVDRECQLTRLMGRDGCTPEEAEKRLLAQLPLDNKKKMADRVIDNMGSREEAIAQVERYFTDFLNRK